MIESDIEVEATFNGILLGRLRKEVNAYSGLDPSIGQSWSTRSYWTDCGESPIEAVKRSVANAKQLLGKPKGPEGIVMTQDVFQQVKRAADSHSPEGCGELNRIYGLQLHVYPTIEEACAAYREMRLQGKNVIFVEVGAEETSE